MDWSRLDFDSSNDEASASRSSLDCASMDSSLASVQTQPMDVDAPPQRAAAAPAGARAAAARPRRRPANANAPSRVFGSPGLVSEVLTWCVTLADVARASSVTTFSARAAWPSIAPRCDDSDDGAVGHPSTRRREERRRRRRGAAPPAPGALAPYRYRDAALDASVVLPRRVLEALVLRLALPEAVAADYVDVAAPLHPLARRVVDAAASRAASVLAVSLTPSRGCVEQGTALACARAMAHGPLCALVRAPRSSQRARESASAALDGLLRCVVKASAVVSSDSDDDDAASRSSSASSLPASSKLKNEVFELLRERRILPDLARLIADGAHRPGAGVGGEHDPPAKPTAHCKRSAASIVCAMVSHFGADHLEPTVVRDLEPRAPARDAATLDRLARG